MKTVIKKLGLIVRLGVTASVLLLGQQAMAVGTDPGVVVSNSVTVDYDVNSVDQTDIVAAAPDVLVDRRVDFTVTRIGTGLTATNENDSGVFVEFHIQNLSNGILDFILSFDELAGVDGEIYPPGPGTADTDVDMDDARIAVSTASGPVAGDGPDPIDGGVGVSTTAINDLAEDEFIRVRIYADTPAGLANLSVAGYRLNATAAAPNAVPLAGDPAEGVALVEDTGANVVGEVDNVFANASGATGTNAIESDVDGFLISSSALVVTKAGVVIDDGIGGTAPNAKAIPGATIEYTITLDNTLGGVAADAVSITDAIDAEVTLIADAYNGGASNISFAVGGTFCLADLLDANGDGCTLAGAPGTEALTIAGIDDSSVPIVPISVAAGATVTVQFQVLVP